jgi:hypothetical protein
MVAQEIRKSTLQPLLDEMDKTLKEGDRPGLFTNGRIVSGLLDGIWRNAKRFDNWMISAYQMEDEIFRLATYLRRKETGFSKSEAAVQARDQFLNYDIRAPWVNAARRSVLPFISYTYRAVPVLAQSIMLRPWKLAKYATIAYLANALAYMVEGDDEDEERRSLEETETGLTWLGAPRMIRMPWSDDYGNPVFLDVRRWVPAGDVFDMNQGHSAFAVPAWLQMGGPLMLAGELVFNKQAFTGQPITNDLTDDWWDKTSKISDWAWKSWMPSAAWVPGSWYWQKIGDAASGAQDPQGRPYDVPMAIASSFGIKLRPEDVNNNFMWKGYEFDQVERELRSQLRTYQRRHARGLLSTKDLQKRQAELLEKMENLQQRRMETFRGDQD